MHQEKTYSPISGYLMLVALPVILIVGALLASMGGPGVLFAFIFIGCGMFPGFFFVNPNSSRVLVLFGDYKGTVKKNGFFWVNPFYSKRSISLRARNFDSEKIKVNDKVGNPIQIGVILVWQVKDTFKAAFEVDNYENF